ncbi:unnamed protein product [Ilex paraguariensis]|uniref:Integrator complex subunit 4/Protein SIEL C-terminal Ig-like domain-containing protein n=1 Tax=Ilex paraguariensis TaxID=185542 RepID=A0ABC8T4L2_9AQUA
MEQQLVSTLEQILNQNPLNKPLSLHTLCLARSLITNPFISQQTISSLLKTLTLTLQSLPTQNPLSLHHIFSLLSDLSIHQPQLCPQIFATIHSFSLLPTTSTRSLADSLCLLISLSERNQAFVPSLADTTESLFLSLCFRPCVSVQHWLLKTVNEFHVRPSVLIMVLLGFTKDPYPYIRKAALDGLAGLPKSVIVDDQSLIEGCYVRAVELLYDMEDCVRCSAVRTVIEWGQVLVASNEDQRKKDWSDLLFVQLCSMVRDMSVKVRVEAFDALGKIPTVTADVLLQTVSKKVLEINKKKKYPGQFTAKQFEIPASNAAGAFVHGLEDEFYEVRRSACFSLRTLTILSSEFAGQILNLLMDVLNDDSTVVRLQAMETLHHMAIFKNLEVQEAHLHMLLGTLVDTSTLIRSAARKILRLTKLHNLDMCKLCLHGLIENLEMYPQDEVDVFAVLFNIGRSHGKLASSVIEEAFQEIEPSFDGKLGLDSARVASLLVLGISTPFSHERHICSIPPIMFSYAVTLLGRISRGLADVMSQDTLLAYLTHCSRSSVFSASEFFKGEEPVSPVVNGDPPSVTCTSTSSPVGMHLLQISDGFCETDSQKTYGPREVITPPVGYQLEVHDEVTNFLKFILAKMKDIWTLIQFGCMDDVIRTLRSWKEELATYATDSLQSAGVLSFISKYLQVVKLLGKVWVDFLSIRKLQLNALGELGPVLGKLDRSLRDMRYRFIGLSKEEELHILELILITYTLRLSYVGVGCPQSALKKLYSTISRVEFLHEEGSIEPSKFVIELRNSLREVGTCDDGDSYSPFLFQKLLEFFSLKQFMLCGELKHVWAELDAQGSDFEDPLPFIAGLPVGIPFEVTLYNFLSETRLWLRMRLDNELTQFVFLDLNQFEGSDEIRKFTFVAPFYKTPKASSFRLRFCIGLECLSEDVHVANYSRGPKHELAYLCKEKDVHLSMVVK